MNDQTDIRQQVAENLRFYSDMRFKQLTLLVAVMTISGAGVAQFGSTSLSAGLRLNAVLAAFAMIFTLVLWVMEVRAVLYWHEHRKVAPDMWPAPPHTYFSWLNATNAVLVLHSAIYGFWLYCALLWNLGPLLLGLFTGLGLVVLAFSIVAYNGTWTTR